VVRQLGFHRELLIHGIDCDKIRHMERTLEDLASEALGLSLESRAALAKRLLDSLDDLAPAEYERL
jgi:hypothetical protein